MSIFSEIYAILCFSRSHEPKIRPCVNNFQTPSVTVMSFIKASEMFDVNEEEDRELTKKLRDAELNAIKNIYI